jgi:hypothetical protein
MSAAPPPTAAAKPANQEANTAKIVHAIVEGVVPAVIAGVIQQIRAIGDERAAELAIMFGAVEASLAALEARLAAADAIAGAAVVPLAEGATPPAMRQTRDAPAPAAPKLGSKLSSKSAAGVPNMPINGRLYYRVLLLGKGPMGTEADIAEAREMAKSRVAAAGVDVSGKEEGSDEYWAAIGFNIWDKAFTTTEKDMWAARFKDQSKPAAAAPAQLEADAD